MTKKKKDRALICTDIQTRIRQMKTKEMPIRQFKITQYKPTYQIDNSALLLLGENKENYSPCQIVGDGNCLFRSVSFSLYGTEDFHLELRARCMIELLLNHHKYLDEKNYLDNQLRYLIVFSREYSKVKNDQDVLWNEAIRGLKLSEWSSPIMVKGLANALALEIQQVFPQVKYRDPNQRGVMNCLISPNDVKPRGTFYI
jgi:hypothetical protein